MAFQIHQGLLEERINCIILSLDVFVIIAACIKGSRDLNCSIGFEAAKRFELEKLTSN